MSKVAIITGGASGMGLAVAASLSQHTSENWSVHIIDLNTTEGELQASNIGAEFHHCDITNYDALASIFQHTYRQHHRLDFVFANAGVFLQTVLHRETDTTDDNDNDDTPPPALNTSELDINLKAVTTTSYLAMHYFHLTRRSLAPDWEGNLVMTASAAAFYPIHAGPLYSASKAGVVNLTRALSLPAKHTQNVRVNCLCPGLVATGMTRDLPLPSTSVTDMQRITSTVQTFIDGGPLSASNGKTVERGEVYGLAVEVTRDIVWVHDRPAFVDELMPALLFDVWSHGFDVRDRVSGEVRRVPREELQALVASGGQGV